MKPQTHPTRVAVTGATGFVGQRLIRTLQVNGWQVTALVRDPSRASRILNPHNSPDISLIKWDLNDENSLTELVNTSALVHLAAYIPKSMNSAREASQCWESNALGTIRLLELAEKAKISHVVHVSTGNAYQFSKDKVIETDSLYPSHRTPYYLMSKVCGEVFATNWGLTTNRIVTILRPSSIYGIGMDPDSLVSRLVRLAQSNDVLTIEDGGRFQADFIHVDDFVSLIFRVLQHQVPGILNAGSGEPATTLQLLECIAKMAGRNMDDIQIHGDQNRPIFGFSPLNISRAREMDGWSPRQLKEGLETMMECGK